MKRIVLCFDGTWNKPADDAIADDEQVETNVRRFYESVPPTDSHGVRQVCWYNAGVGTAWYDELAGGALGAFLDKHILDGYRQLVDVYEEGDEVYIVGFSRGAYTARSLVGMIRNCGLIIPKWGTTAKIGLAYGVYRAKKDPVDSITARAVRKLSRQIPIRFLGVWDTVGALGIPPGILSRFDELNAEFYKFHDTELSNIVENAYQAVALDEHREDYNICLWNPRTAPQQTIEQRWFCGAHSDVGGGYPSRALSDIALRWMQDKAANLGLELEKVTLKDQGYLGELTDSYAAFLKGKFALLRKRFFRTVLTTPFGKEVLDESIGMRRKATALNPAYTPKNVGLPQ